MDKIAIIPARSGSKGLKDKNVIDMCGKPMIAYTIEAAVNASLFKRIIVSTDSERYAAVAETYGAEVMYRGEELSNDKATTYMVVEDVLKRSGEEFPYFALLQPTSPLRTDRHIREAVCLFEANLDRFDFLVSVKEAEYGQNLVKPIGEDGSLKYFDADFSGYRRQSFREYTPNGAIFLGKKDAYMEKKHFFGSRSVAYKMSQFESVDIDNELDYEFACLCMRRRDALVEGGQLK